MLCIYEALKSRPTSSGHPFCRDRLKVLVSHVESPDSFYVQLCNDVTMENIDFLEQLTPCLNEVNHPIGEVWWAVDRIK